MCSLVADSANPLSSYMEGINFVGRVGEQAVDGDRCMEGDAAECRPINNRRGLEENITL